MKLTSISCDVTNKFGGCLFKITKCYCKTQETDSFTYNVHEDFEIKLHHVIYFGTMSGKPGIRFTYKDEIFFIPFEFFYLDTQIAIDFLEFALLQFSRIFKHIKHTFLFQPINKQSTRVSFKDATPSIIMLPQSQSEKAPKFEDNLLNVIEEFPCEFFRGEIVYVDVYGYDRVHQTFFGIYKNILLRFNVMCVSNFMDIIELSNTKRFETLSKIISNRRQSEEKAINMKCGFLKHSVEIKPHDVDNLLYQFTIENTRSVVETGMFVSGNFTGNCVICYDVMLRSNQFIFSDRYAFTNTCNITVPFTYIVFGEQQNFTGLVVLYYIESNYLSAIVMDTETFQKGQKIGLNEKQIDTKLKNNENVSCNNITNNESDPFSVFNELF